MQVYFSEISQEEASAFDAAFFEVRDKLYDFEVSIDAEMFKVADSLGRFVPFSLSDINRLIQALETIKPLAVALAAAEAAQDTLEKNITITLKDK